MVPWNMRGTFRPLARIFWGGAENPRGEAGMKTETGAQKMVEAVLHRLEPRVRPLRDWRPGREVLEIAELVIEG